MEVFGITGTNGKTTTSYMTDHILGELGIKSALVGTISHRIGENVYEAVIQRRAETCLKDILPRRKDRG